MNYEYGTSDCYEFIDRPRGWEPAKQPFMDRYPFVYCLIVAAVCWALIIAPWIWV